MEPPCLEVLLYLWIPIVRGRNLEGGLLPLLVPALVGCHEIQDAELDEWTFLGMIQQASSVLVLIY